MSPLGRRAGAQDTRAAILAAAKRAFGRHGFDAASMRGIARDAGVDPALLVHYYGNKAGLFEASLELPVDPDLVVAALLDGDPADLGSRLVQTFLGVWDATPGQGPMLALLRGAVTHEDSAGMLRELLQRRLIRPVVDGIGADRPDVRAALVASQMVGLALTRYVLRLEPLASAVPVSVISWIGPTVQRYLTGQLD